MSTALSFALPSRVSLTLALCLAALSPARLAHAGDKIACIEASERGQELRDEGKLIAAREQLLLCASDACPALIKTDCAAWLSDLSARTPSIVISARGPDGRDTADVKVSLDGKIILSKLDGRAIPIDPGEHAVRYERDGSPAIDEKVVIREGQQRRVLVAIFKAGEPASPAKPIDTPPPPPPSPSGVPASAIVLAGVAIAGGAAFTGLALSAKSDVDAMRRTCAPRCDESDVDAARAKLIVANISLGAGVIALGAAAWIFFTRPATAPPRTAAPSLDVLPAPGGGSAVLRGRF